MSDLIDTYRELLAQTRHYVTTNLLDGKRWIHADPSGIVIKPPVSLQSAPVMLSPLPPVPTRIPSRPALTPVATVAATSLPVQKVLSPPIDKPKARVEIPVVSESKTLEPDPVKKLFSLTPLPAVVDPGLEDFKKLIATVAPAVRLIDAIPAAAVTTIHRLPEGAIALILTPKFTSAEANAFLEAVATAVELRFGPCGILDSHTLVSAKHGFPPPGPRLIPIADPMIYLREPMRKAELWNDIRRKLGKPAVQP